MIYDTFLGNFVKKVYGWDRIWEFIVVRLGGKVTNGGGGRGVGFRFSPITSDGQCVMMFLVLGVLLK